MKNPATLDRVLLDKNGFNLVQGTVVREPDKKPEYDFLRELV